MNHPTTMKYHKQRGITAISFILLMMLLGFMLLIVIKLFPVYIQHFKITAALKALPTDARAQGGTDAEIKNLLLKKLSIDDVDDINKDNIVINKNKGFRSVTINHESRVHVLWNVDAVVVYNAPEIKVK